MKLPKLLTTSEIKTRLDVIFPDGTTDRGYLTRDVAVNIIFTMIYSGAVEGAGIWIGPKHVYRMSTMQASIVDDDVRRDYGMNAWKRRFVNIGKAWYADTSREQIRDETIRALMRSGAVIERSNIATTSSKPRYAMASDFEELFDPDVSGAALYKLIASWQKIHLAAHALARVELIRQRVASGSGTVDVTLPNRGVRQLAPGPSALITKAVIEEFAPRFLYSPTVLLLSESRKKVIDVDLAATKMIGLELTPSLILPDVILFDTVQSEELLVFVEVVANDGPVTLERREALRSLVPFFSENRIAFVTAYSDRGAPAFRKTVGSLAWNTLVWFASEPDHAIILREATSLEERRIFDFLDDYG